MSVLVILEAGRDGMHRMSWDALAAGQDAGSRMGVEVCAAVAGENAGALAGEAARYALSRVYALEDARLRRYTAEAYTAAYQQLIERLQPSLVLFPHTYQTRDYAPALATRLGRVLVSDVIGLRISDAAEPVFSRRIFQGKLQADYRPVGGAPWLASIQAGAWRADQLRAGNAVVESVAAIAGETAIRVAPSEPFREAARSVDLGAADLIVAVGRGIREKENLRIVEELAQALGAEIAASRPICDNGWLPMERQVGSSGQTVAPKLYLAIGISGAIQHLVGMKGSRTIVAINRDPAAPIFEVANYGIVGDLFEIVPALTALLKRP